MSRPADIAEAVEILRRHNAWRRYDGELDAPDAPEACDPRELGRAIDMAVQWIEAALEQRGTP